MRVPSAVFLVLAIAASGCSRHRPWRISQSAAMDGVERVIAQVFDGQCPTDCSLPQVPSRFCVQLEADQRGTRPDLTGDGPFCFMGSALNAQGELIGRACQTVLSGPGPEINLELAPASGIAPACIELIEGDAGIEEPMDAGRPVDGGRPEPVDANLEEPADAGPLPDAGREPPRLVVQLTLGGTVIVTPPAVRLTPSSTPGVVRSYGIDGLTSGTSMVLLAEPASGVEFDRWTGDECAGVNQPECTFELRYGTTTVRAHWR